MNKFVLLMIASIFTSMMVFSQTTEQKIEKLSKDPQTAENAAKADVYVLKNKKVISDTTTRQVCNQKLSRKQKKRRKS